MKSKQREVVELADELVRLNALVRERRKQLVFLERCPNKECQCRTVWRDVVEKKLACQVGKIRKQVGQKNGKAAPGAVKSKAGGKRAAA